MPFKSFPFSEKEFSLSGTKYFLGSDVRIFTGFIRVDEITRRKTKLAKWWIEEIEIPVLFDQFTIFPLYLGSYPSDPSLSVQSKCSHFWALVLKF